MLGRRRRPPPRSSIKAAQTFGTGTSSHAAAGQQRLGMRAEERLARQLFERLAADLPHGIETVGVFVARHLTVAIINGILRPLHWGATLQVSMRARASPRDAAHPGDLTI